MFRKQTLFQPDSKSGPCGRRPEKEGGGQGIAGSICDVKAVGNCLPIGGGKGATRLRERRIRGIIRGDSYARLSRKGEASLWGIDDKEFCSQGRAGDGQ